jgi:hypothetical protein
MHEELFELVRQFDFLTCLRLGRPSSNSNRMCLEGLRAGKRMIGSVEIKNSSMRRPGGTMRWDYVDPAFHLALGSQLCTFSFTFPIPPTRSAPSGAFQRPGKYLF